MDHLQFQPGADLSAQVGAGPVDHRRVGCSGSTAGAGQSAVELQAGLGDAAQGITGHRGLADRGLRAQPTPSLTGALGGQYGQQLHIGQRGPQAAASAQIQTQASPANDQPVHHHAGAIAQALCLVALRFKEQVALGCQYIGHLDAHAATDARFAIDQRNLVEPVGTAHGLFDIAAPAVERQLQAVCAEGDRIPCGKGQIAFGLHGVHRANAHLIAQQHGAPAVGQGGL